MNTLSNSLTADKMINDYQQLAVRTLKVIEPRIDKLHMVVGIVGEEDELNEANLKQDYVNVMEEVGDKFWYIAVLCELYGLQFTDVLREDMVSTTKESLLHSRLCDLIKRDVIYNKGIDLDTLKKLLGDISYHCLIEVQFANTNLTSSTSYMIALSETLKKNINKLSARYPDKFTDYLANNRDLDVERKVLEQ